MAPFPIGKFVETFLDQSKDDARRLIRHEMESMLDPLVESLFKQLKNKFVHYLEDSSSSSSSGCFNQELILEHNIGVDEHLIRDQQTISNANQYHCPSLSNAPSMDANCQLNLPNHQPALMSIKQEINDPSNVLFKPQHNHHSINSASSTQESSSQFPPPMIPSTSIGESLSNIELIQQPQQPAQIKHNQFDDEEECDECIDGGIAVKEEDGDDDDSFQLIDDDQEDEQSTRAVKRPRMDSTQPNNAQLEVTRHSMRQEIDETHSNEDRLNDESDQMECEQNIDTQTTIGDVHVQHNSDESMVIQQEESDVNNAIGEEIATECTNNPTQLNILHPNLKFACQHCAKWFASSDTLNSHEQAIHHHVKPYRCKQCGHTATQRSSIIRHIRIVHFGLPKSTKQQRALNIIDHRDPRELVENLF